MSNHVFWNFGQLLVWLAAPDLACVEAVYHIARRTEEDINAEVVHILDQYGCAWLSDMSAYREINRACRDGKIRVLACRVTDWDHIGRPRYLFESQNVTPVLWHDMTVEFAGARSLYNSKIVWCRLRFRSTDVKKLWPLAGKDFFQIVPETLPGLILKITKACGLPSADYKPRDLRDHRTPEEIQQYREKVSDLDPRSACIKWVGSLPPHEAGLKTKSELTAFACGEFKLSPSLVSAIWKVHAPLAYQPRGRPKARR